jgi:aldehyde:ferredoxin oxidoreductase
VCLLPCNIPRHANPLGLSNVLVILTGTPAVISWRFVADKSPKNNCWGDADCCGFFVPRSKFVGFDRVLFGGVSRKPVNLLIEDGKPELETRRTRGPGGDTSGGHSEGEL